MFLDAYFSVLCKETFRSPIKRVMTKMFFKRLANFANFTKVVAKANSARLASCLFMAGVCFSASADISISTTIRPLYFIALAIVGERGDAKALIDSKSSPHQFSLTPSDRLELLNSDVIVWVGSELESQLSSSLSKVVADDRVITASTLSGLVSHKLGDGEQLDAHIWLDTRNASLIASEIAEFAKRIDPLNADYYQTNLSKFKKNLNQAADEISQRFEQANIKSFAVYHNGFQYFEKQFGLNHQLELVRDPEIAPTIAEILETRKKAELSKPRCLFQEPDANLELIRTMLNAYQLDVGKLDQTANDSIHVVTIDLLGNDIEESPLAYIDLINHVAEEFNSCLSIEPAANTSNTTANNTANVNSIAKNNVNKNR